MSFANRPDKVTCDAFSDATLENQNLNGVYSRFTNRLTTPILNAKGIQLINANFVNPILQLNDAGQLVFWYRRSVTQAGIYGSANLRCIRLHPSTFVPYPGFTDYTKNEYFNTVQELVTALNLAANAGGDSVTYNPFFVAGDLVFSYDNDTRKISVTSGAPGVYIAPCAADDPFIALALQGLSPFTPASSYQIKMNGYNSSNNNATATLQTYVLNQSMNARLGFAMSFSARGIWWGASSQQGVATSTGVPNSTKCRLRQTQTPS